MKSILVLLLLIPTVAAQDDGLETILTVFITLVGLLILAGLAYLFIQYRIKKRQELERLTQIREYVQQMLARNYPPDMIKQALINYRWEEKLIDKALEQAKPMNLKTQPKTA